MSRGRGMVLAATVFMAWEARVIRSDVSTPTVPLVQEGPVRWRIQRHGAMRVPGIVFASKTLLPDVLSDRSLAQVVNVAALPGIVEASYAMPDIHWG